MRRGLTLIELLVTLAIMAIALTITAMGLRPLAQWQNLPTGDYERAKAQAVMSGQAVLYVNGRDSLRFLPDGRAVPNLWTRGEVDPLTGEHSSAQH